MDSPSGNGKFIVALDQGTTSSRAILYDKSGKQIKTASRPVPISCPADGWVEQDAQALWLTTRECLDEVTAGLKKGEVISVGLTNQRETTVVWDKVTGKALAPAIVWQCRRSAQICEALRKQGLGEFVRKETGLVIDSYFSASKIIWLLENVPGLKAKAANAEAVFGTVDSWILFCLNIERGEKVFLTEPSNASRTMLYSLQSGGWNEKLLKIAGITCDNVCEVISSNQSFGCALVNGEEVRITGVLGDQQASLFGHGGIGKEQVKCTFGTGAFLLINKGQELAESSSGMLSTVAWQLAEGQGEVKSTFALEGSVFIAGALIQWLRDGLRLIANSSESEALAESVSSSEGVVIVPAFVGLGAPYWNEGARGIICGLTRGVTKAHVARAALEAIAHQVADLTEASEFSAVTQISIDGGMSANKLFCQILANLTAKEIAVARSGEMTAFGAARMAAIGAGLFSSADDAVTNFNLADSGAGTKYLPLLSEPQRQKERGAWKKAIRQCLAS